MDPLLTLPLIVSLWCAINVIQFVRVVRTMGGRVHAWGYLVKIAIVMAGIWTGAAIRSDTVVDAAAVAWVVFLLAPLWLSLRHARARNQRDYLRARWFAHAIRLLHPFDGWRAEPATLSLLDRVRVGDTLAIGLLRLRCEEDTGLPDSRAVALLEIARLSGDWSGLLTQPLYPGAAALRLRALGETGQLDALVDLCTRLPADPGADLMLFVFAGRTAGVDAVLSGATFAMLTDKQRDFWIATSVLVSHPADDAARTRLNASVDGPQHPSLTTLRLEGRLRSPAGLSPEHRTLVDARERAVLLDKAEGRLQPPPQPHRKPIATLALIAANLIAFGWQWWHGGWAGTTDPDMLYDLGALWAPALVQHGEWSRLVTALFLHAGVLHFTLNMTALLPFGLLVEQRVGRLFLLTAYLVTGIGSMAGVVMVERVLGTDPILLVGASGAILGLFGTYTGMLLRDITRRTADARRLLPRIALVIGVQMLFDFLVPQVSFAAHACGFLIGVAIGLVARGIVAPDRRSATSAKAM